MKSTFEIEENEWNKYASKVAETFGTRKLGDVIVIMIKAFNRGLIDIEGLKDKVAK